jgi:hypothetical protein
MEAIEIAAKEQTSGQLAEALATSVLASLLRLIRGLEAVTERLRRVVRSDRTCGITDVPAAVGPPGEVDSIVDSHSYGPQEAPKTMATDKWPWRVVRVLRLCHRFADGCAPSYTVDEHLELLQSLPEYLALHDGRCASVRSHYLGS